MNPRVVCRIDYHDYFVEQVIFEYFYVLGVLRDFDIPDLTRLVATSRQLWIDLLNEVSERMTIGKASEALLYTGGLHVMLISSGLASEISGKILNSISRGIPLQ